jgi:hypothetical protein
VTQVPPRALVVLRVARGAPPPAEDEVRRAIASDRAHLRVPPGETAGYRIAGPYEIELGGRALDEYVAWEV